MKAQHNAELTYAGRTPTPCQHVCKWEAEHQAREPTLLLQRDAGQVCQVGVGAGNPSHASFPYSPYQRSSR